MAFDYVKFRRGNADAFSALNPKDPNTLYFVYANPAAKKGLLYLGDKLIGGGLFSELSDVDIENAQPGDILIYTNVGTEEEPEWVWKASTPEILKLIPDDAVLPEGSNLAPGDSLSQAIMKLDEAIGLADSNTWRAVHVNGVEALSNAITSGAVNFAAGDGIVLNAQNGTITISLGNNLIEVLTELFGEHPEILPIYDGENPGLVPAAPATDPEDEEDVPANYVLGGNGTWINIRNLGPFWEDLETLEIFVPAVNEMVLNEAIEVLNHYNLPYEISSVSEDDTGFIDNPQDYLVYTQEPIGDKTYEELPNGKVSLIVRSIFQ